MRKLPWYHTGSLSASFFSAGFGQVKGSPASPRGCLAWAEEGDPGQPELSWALPLHGRQLSAVPTFAPSRPPEPSRRIVPIPCVWECICSQLRGCSCSHCKCPVTCPLVPVPSPSWGSVAPCLPEHPPLHCSESVHCVCL